MQYLTNTAPILRRRPGDPLRPLSGAAGGFGGSVDTPDDRDSLPVDMLLGLPGTRGLCPELREVFSMTMTTGDLPFPSSKRGRRQGDADAVEASVDVDDVEVQRQQEVSGGSCGVQISL